MSLFAFAALLWVRWKQKKDAGRHWLYWLDMVMYFELACVVTVVVDLLAFVGLGVWFLTFLTGGTNRG